MTDLTHLTQRKVGILGGGQLGCMLADAALGLGLEPILLADATSPAAALFSERTVRGSVTDTAVLRDFLSRAPVVAFENEFLDCDALQSAAQGLSVRYAPGLDVVRVLQDKLRQKELLTRLGIPTAEFLSIQPSTGSADAWTHQAYDALEGEVVLKWSRLGYDGKGVCLARDSADGRKEALEFCQASLARGIAVYAERKIAFKRELAIVAARSGGASRPTDLIAYPLVVSEQERGVCKRVLGPATALGVPPRLEIEATEAARKLGDALGLEGVFAIELFESAAGEILVNEIAPRVHNSGHYSQDACRVSQFENHWRAILGAPSAPKPRAGFGMLNLLGPEGMALSLAQSRDTLPFSRVPEPARLHWYGKSEIRPGRKVGHLNAATDDPKLIPELASQLDRAHAGWIRDLEQLKNRQSPRSP
jgi:5-(carboxyamino)imidazole ribonucleotide synthase